MEQIARTFSFAIDPRARVENISVGQQQRVEILKALYRGAEILILDEPTAVLTPQEAQGALRDPALAHQRGHVGHLHQPQAPEVLDIADRVTVLRRGKQIETLPREGATQAQLAKSMVGREVLLRVDKKPAEPGESLLRWGTCRSSTSAGCPPCEAFRSTVGRARSSASPASTATVRPS